MHTTEENVFQAACRTAEALISRDTELGTYSGDGPTTEQTNALIQACAQLAEPLETAHAKLFWEAFKCSTECIASWLYPERDSLAQVMLPLLVEVQGRTGAALESIDPNWHAELERFANLHTIARAAKRQTELRGNTVDWRIACARLLNKIGARTLAENLANSAVEKWSR